MKLIATTRQLQVGAALWFCAVITCAVLSHPSIGQIAAIEPDNPFWEVIRSVNPKEPFAAQLNWSYLLAAGLGPLVLGWLVLKLARLTGWRRYGSVA